MPHMIGELKFMQQGRTCSASLDSRLHWLCDNSEIEAFLNTAYPMASDAMDVHRPAVHLLYEVAERLGGVVALNRDAHDADQHAVLA